MLRYPSFLACLKPKIIKAVAFVLFIVLAQYLLVGLVGLKYYPLTFDSYISYSRNYTWIGFFWYFYTLFPIALIGLLVIIVHMVLGFAFLTWVMVFFATQSTPIIYFLASMVIYTLYLAGNSLLEYHILFFLVISRVYTFLITESTFQLGLLPIGVTLAVGILVSVGIYHYLKKYWWKKETKARWIKL